MVLQYTVLLPDRKTYAHCYWCYREDHHLAFCHSPVAVLEKKCLEDRRVRLVAWKNFPQACCYNFPPSAYMLNFSKDTNMSNARTRVCSGVLWRAWQQCLYYYRMRVINNRHWILHKWGAVTYTARSHRAMKG